MMTERQTLKIEEAAKIHGISRYTAYDAVENGQLPTVKIGSRFLVPKVRSIACWKTPRPPQPDRHDSPCAKPKVIPVHPSQLT
jgi:excisionase family DNA binding protein